MTKEQAIKAIKEHCYFANLVPDAKEALDLAIKALEQQPSDDCVSRQAVTNTVENTIAKYIPTFIGLYEQIPLELARAIKDVPPVTPTHCIAEVKFSKEDLREICNERIEVECTHGTCKDCRNAIESHYNKCICCTLLGCNCNEDFYCQEYKKRGGENGSN